MQVEKKTEEELFQESIATFAEKMKVSKSTVRGLILRREIPCLKLGKHYRLSVPLAIAALKNRSN